MHINGDIIPWNIEGNWICFRKQLAADNWPHEYDNCMTNRGCINASIQIPSAF